MDLVFNPSSYSDEGSESKRLWMAASSVMSTKTFNIDGNLPLPELIRSFNKLVHHRHIYMIKKMEDRPSRPNAEDLEAAEEQLRKYTTTFLDHDKIIRIFRESLDAQWPTDELPKLQEIETERGGLSARLKSKSKSKRSRSYIRKDTGEEGSSQKRLRMQDNL